MSTPTSKVLRALADRPLTRGAIRYLDEHGVTALDPVPELLQRAADELDMLYEEVKHMSKILSEQQCTINVDRSEGSPHAE